MSEQAVTIIREQHRNTRRIAQQLSLTVISTVGMLLRAEQKDVIAEVKPLLTALAQVDFRIAKPLVPNALCLAGNCELREA